MGFAWTETFSIPPLKAALPRSRRASQQVNLSNAGWTTYIQIPAIIGVAGFPRLEGCRVVRGIVGERAMKEPTKYKTKLKQSTSLNSGEYILPGQGQNV